MACISEIFLVDCVPFDDILNQEIILRSIDSSVAFRNVPHRLQVERVEDFFSPKSDFFFERKHFRLKRSHRKTPFWSLGPSPAAAAATTAAATATAATTTTTATTRTATAASRVKRVNELATMERRRREATFV